MCSFVAALKKHIESYCQFYYSHFIFFLIDVTVVALTCSLLLLGVIFACFEQCAANVKFVR